MAGGSVANTVRGLSAGFGVYTRTVRAYGDDDQGQKFVYNMGYNGVDLSRMRKKGLTGQVSFMKLLCLICLSPTQYPDLISFILTFCLLLGGKKIKTADSVPSKWKGISFLRPSCH
ncbi:hypothetical protein SAY86_012196 [Trapa natans]|uniref:Carbohydrate kinase PfkB domain-containing protein n=1 Tax=Trapa natans TaxID=22666 RepID=A0AAN7LX37_TRANT|nr:hypothetical protein SAY86_012196 [Trapa natans]